MVEQQGSGVSAAGLVERLRTDAAWLKRRSKCEVVAADIAEAADTIEALTAQLTRQSEAAALLPAIIDGPCGPEWGPMIAQAYETRHD